MRSVDEQRQTWRRVGELLREQDRHERARAVRMVRDHRSDEHRAEMRDALCVVPSVDWSAMRAANASRRCPEPRCTLHAGHKGTCWDSMSGKAVRP